VLRLLWALSFSHVSVPRPKVSTALVSPTRPEAPASQGASARWYSVFKNLWIHTIVEAIGELVQVERQVLPADAVMGSHDAALRQAPERIQIVGVNLPANIFTSTVAHCLAKAD
jgi:hypothetical protein